MTDLAAVTGPFVATAASAGVRPPLRLIEQDVRGWAVLQRGGDTLCVDEYGDLWWAKEAGRGDLRVIRSAWPEEARSLLEPIAAALDHILRPPA